MANLSQTAGNVKLLSATQPAVGIAGEALTQGQPFYFSASKGYKCDALAAANKAAAAGIVLTPAASDGTFLYAVPGAEVDLGATLAVGQVYCVSATSGAICPYADLVSTNRVTILGVASTTAKLLLDISVSNTQKA
jgi:hypothetical protein